jgi:hypothetical protein
MGQRGNSFGSSRAEAEHVFIITMWVKRGWTSERAWRLRGYGPAGKFLRAWPEAIHTRGDFSLDPPRTTGKPRRESDETRGKAVGLGPGTSLLHNKIYCRDDGGVCQR